MRPPVAYLDVTVGLTDRARIRRGLTRLRERQLIDWVERREWWRSVFTTWGSPAAIAALVRILGPIAAPPPQTRGRQVDLTI